MKKYEIDDKFFKTIKFRNLYNKYFNFKRPSINDCPNLTKDYEYFVLKLENCISRDASCCFQLDGWHSFFVDLMLAIYKIDEYAKYSHIRLKSESACITGFKQDC